MSPHPKLNLWIIHIILYFPLKAYNIIKLLITWFSLLSPPLLGQELTLTDLYKPTAFNIVTVL